MGALIEVVADARFTADVLVGFEPEGKRVQKLLKDISKGWLELVELGFSEERDPFGVPWEPLASFTIKKKKKEGASDPERILYFTGSLSQSFYSTIGSDRFSIQSRDQENADKQASGEGKSTGKGRPIPSRVMIPDGDAPLPMEWQDVIDRNVNRFLESI